MINLSQQTMRKLVKFNSKLLLNPRCPIWLQRLGLDTLGRLSRLPKSIKIEKTTLVDRTAWWFDYKKRRSESITLYFHGGGYSIGSPRSHRDLCAYLAKSAKQSVVSFSYRLAPEHPYPAALDDAMAAYQELLAQGYDPARIAVAGDSAGGGLALSLSIRLKAFGVPQPACLFLISPLINKKKKTASYVTQYDLDPVINVKWSEQLAENYLQKSAELLDEACLSDKDMADIPPLLIHVGTDEVLLDDSLMLKQRAMQAGVKVQLMTYPELWHVFHFNPSLFAQARMALKQAGEYIKTHNQ
ncbi:alpha/beta hydrolase [Marinicella sp. S1101]|uniref:alpha/beta hydrolase n=1 Tax=Marinicella marina TaxID=2996016 RepID=UPI002260F308|nr:alpha/beta hydrolase [Marinicella marina]MCX7553407.1 alpha/beta hydrolase [Marinicella marina]